jgi:hypothetical protein
MNTTEIHCGRCYYSMSAAAHATATIEHPFETAPTVVWGPAKTLTYLGARAAIRTLRRAGKAGTTAERVVVFHWLDRAVGQPVEHPAGTFELRWLKGDGRKGETAVLREATTDLEGVANRLAEEWLQFGV